MRKSILLALLMTSVFGVKAQLFTPFSDAILLNKEMKRSEVKSLKHASKAVAPVPSWKESFEGCDENDMFWLPEGWTAKRTEAFTDPKDPHTWAIIKQYNAFYPAPVDGTHYATCYYNDNAQQDEWLCTPALTPKQGEYFTYYVSLMPFFLFDISKYDEKNGVMTEKIPSADLRLHVSVDGGEWQQLNSMFDIYKDEDINALYEVAHNGYLTNRKMFIDMTPYIGKSVRFGFQYVGIGGNSLYLDDLQLVEPSLTVAYDKPETALYFGMTPDFRQPTNNLFVPDNTPLLWQNRSSLEATDFDWVYADQHDYAKTLHSNTPSLLTNYDAYVPRAQQTTGRENIVAVPTLNVEGIASLKGSYTHPSAEMMVGGKAYYPDTDGTPLHTGATYCDPAKGHHIMTTSQGAPYFGVGQGNKELWTAMFGTEATVTGVGVHVPQPQKAWTMRGLHIQGIGSIERYYRLHVAVRKFNVYGSVDDEPIATAIIDTDNIVALPIAGSDYKQYTLPFIFPDPLTINQDVIITLEGLPRAATWFAPLQTQQNEANVEHSHAIFVYDYNDNYGIQTGMNYVSNLAVKNAEGNYEPCATNFFFNFDIAYGDHDDWGHVDIEQQGPSMPELTYQDNTIVFVDAETMQSQFAEELEYKPLLCGFYDENENARLSLYVCIGQLYEYEEGPFYSDRVNDTYYMKITLPKDYVDGKEHAIDRTTVSMDYYDLLSHSWVFSATEGKVVVSETAPHVYSVDVKALDATACLAIGARYIHTDPWRWRDYNEERPDPSQFELKKSGRVVAHHDILSCVVDNSNTDIPVFYFADQEGLTSVAAVTALNAEQYVRISMPATLIDGLLKGFSGWSDDNLTVTYKGIDYNHSGCQNDETCFGGNVGVVLFDTEEKHAIVNSTIFTMINEDRCNMSLHYDGPFVFDADAGIDENVYDNDNENGRTAQPYNLLGQRISAAPKGIYILNGKKHLVR